MPALPALLLWIHVAVPLLTVAPPSLGQTSVLSAVRMGEYRHRVQVWILESGGL